LQGGGVYGGLEAKRRFHHRARLAPQLIQMAPWQQGFELVGLDGWHVADICANLWSGKKTIISISY
jgi:hypothetical protein